MSPPRWLEPRERVSHSHASLSRRLRRLVLLTSAVYVSISLISSSSSSALLSTSSEMEGAGTESSGYGCMDSTMTFSSDRENYGNEFLFGELKLPLPDSSCKLTPLWRRLRLLRGGAGHNGGSADEDNDKFMTVGSDADPRRTEEQSSEKPSPDSDGSVGIQGESNVSPDKREEKPEHARASFEWHSPMLGDANGDKSSQDDSPPPPRTYDWHEPERTSETAGNIAKDDTMPHGEEEGNHKSSVELSYEKEEETGDKGRRQRSEISRSMDDDARSLSLSSLNLNDIQDDHRARSSPSRTYDWHAVPAGEHVSEAAHASDVEMLPSEKAAEKGPMGYVVTMAGVKDYNAKNIYRDGVNEEANFLSPFGLSVAPDGSLIVADRKGSRIRRIELIPGSALSSPAQFLSSTSTSAKLMKKNIINEKNSNDNDNNIGPDDNNENDAHPAGNSSSETLSTNHEDCMERRQRSHSNNLEDGDEQILSNWIPRFNVTTLSGCGYFGWWDGPSDFADYYHPTDVCCLDNGDIYVCDHLNHRIRKIDSQRNNEVTTFAGSLRIQELKEVPRSKDDLLEDKLMKPEIFAEGTEDGWRTKCAQFDEPSAIAVGPGGYIYVTDTNNDRIRRVSLGGGQACVHCSSKLDCPDHDFVSTYAGLHGFSGRGFDDGPIYRAQFYHPQGIAVTPNGNVYVSEWTAQRIRLVTPRGRVSTFAGNGLQGLIDGIGQKTSFNYPLALAADIEGNIYVADKYNNAIRKITPGSEVTTIAGNNGQGMQDGALDVAQFDGPRGIAIDKEGSIYVSDFQTRCIRKIVFGEKAEAMTRLESLTRSYHESRSAAADPEIPRNASEAAYLPQKDPYDRFHRLKLPKSSTPRILKDLMPDIVKHMEDNLLCDPMQPEWDSEHGYRSNKQHVVGPGTRVPLH